MSEQEDRGPEPDSIIAAPPDSHSRAVAAEIATRLQEANIGLIAQVVQVIGEEGARRFLDETLAVEARGGMFIVSGGRRRTPGGVFFHLVKNGVPGRARRAIWPTEQDAFGARLRPVALPLVWDDRLPLLQDALASKGTVMTAKLTLIGRPGKVVETPSCVLVAMQVSAKLPALPKGLPEPPARPTDYVVYIGLKQWARVKDTLKNPGDLLIVEGFPVYDEQLPGMALLVQSTTTKLIEQAKRQGQQDAGPAGKG